MQKFHWTDDFFPPEQVNQPIGAAVLKPPVSPAAHPLSFMNAHDFWSDSNRMFFPRTSHEKSFARNEKSATATSCRLSSAIVAFSRSSESHPRSLFFIARRVQFARSDREQAGQFTCLAASLYLGDIGRVALQGSRPAQPKPADRSVALFYGFSRQCFCPGRLCSL
jgi:hypothetical protein